jgi:hypothetical protein
MRSATFIAAVAVASACGGAAQSKLDGTIQADATLDFDEVRAEYLVDRMSIRYLNGSGLTMQEPVRLTMDASLATDGAELKIVDQVVVEHFVSFADDSGRVMAEKPFPMVEHGSLKLTKVSQNVGDLIEGTFDITFVGPEDTLSGEFHATVTPPH